MKKQRIRKIINQILRPNMDVTMKDLKSTTDVINLKKRIKGYFKYSDRPINSTLYIFTDTLINKAYIIAYYSENADNIDTNHKKAYISIKQSIVCFLNDIIDNLCKLHRGILEGDRVRNLIKEYYDNLNRDYYNILCMALHGYTKIYPQYLNVFDIKKIKNLDTRYRYQVTIGPTKEYINVYDKWITELLDYLKETVLSCGVSEADLKHSIIMHISESLVKDSMEREAEYIMMTETFTKLSEHALTLSEDEILNGC